MRYILTFFLILVSSHALAEKDWFIGVAVGGETHDTSHQVSSGAVDLLFNPSDSVNSIAVNLGYQIHENWFATIEYSRFDMDEVEVDNLYATLNYLHRFSDSIYSGYAGLLAGRSELDWQEDPIVAAVRQSQSEEDVWGAQAGLLVDLSENWRLNLAYRYINASHETQLMPLGGSSEFMHEDFQTISVGVEVLF